MLKERKQKINFIRSLPCLIFDLLSMAAFTLQWQSSCNKDPLQRLKYLVPAPAVNESQHFLLVMECLATLISLKELKMIKVVDLSRKEILSML